MHQSAENLGLFTGLAFGFYFLLVSMVLGGVAIYGNWRLYEKAGRPGWAALIPIYNIVVLHEIVGRDPIKLLLLLIPFVNIYFAITLHISLAKSFGKRDMGGYLLTIFFAPFYLGLGAARYVGPSEQAGGAANSNFPPAAY